MIRAEQAVDEDAVSSTNMCLVPKAEKDMIKLTLTSKLTEPCQSNEGSSRRPRNQRRSTYKQESEMVPIS